MQLKTDERSRLTGREVLKPNTSYEVTVLEDGAIRLVELVPKEVPTVDPVRVNGRWQWPVKLGSAEVARVIREERDGR